MNRALKIGILEGDDIGLEVVPECIKVIQAAARKAALDIEWHEIPVGRQALDKPGYTLPPGTLEWPATQRRLPVGGEFVIKRESGSETVHGKVASRHGDAAQRGLTWINTRS